MLIFKIRERKTCSEILAHLKTEGRKFSAWDLPESAGKENY